MLTIVLMPILKLNNPDVPESCRGYLLVDRFGIPRFWPTVWADVLRARNSAGTRKRNLYSIESLYAHSEETLGYGGLDRSLTQLDMDALEVALTGFLASLRNQAAARRIDNGQTWAVVQTFVADIVQHLATQDEAAFAKVQARLIRLNRLYGQLTPNKGKPVARIRALPSTIVHELIQTFSPQSEQNPFRTQELKWRNFLIFLLMLQLGLRRGEIAVLSVDAFRCGYDHEHGKERYWLNIQHNPYEEHDPRFEEPSLKTAFSVRQIPVTSELFHLARRYIENYRGRQELSFLFVSQKNLPISLRSVHKVLEVATSRLSDSAKEELKSRGYKGVSPHDLRHTCAAFRLRQYVEVGRLPIDEAAEKLRNFFGWAPESQMPRLYARAYFEPREAEVWDANYSAVVDALRAIEDMK